MEEREREEALSETAVPLFFLKLLFQEAAGPATELVRPEPGARPEPACACAHGPHLLLPGCASQWSLQFSAGALPAYTVQSRCAPSRSTGCGWGGPRYGEGPPREGVPRVTHSPGHRHLLLPRDPPSTVPASSSSGIPPQVGAAPTLRFPTSRGARGQNARFELQGPTSASPSPNSQAAQSSLPILGHSAKVRIPDTLKDRADGAEAGQQMGRDWQTAEIGVRVGPEPKEMESAGAPGGTPRRC